MHAGVFEVVTWTIGEPLEIKWPTGTNPQLLHVQINVILFSQDLLEVETCTKFDILLQCATYVVLIIAYQTLPEVYDYIYLPLLCGKYIPACTYVSPFKCDVCFGMHALVNPRSKVRLSDQTGRLCLLYIYRRTTSVNCLNLSKKRVPDDQLVN